MKASYAIWTLAATAAIVVLTGCRAMPPEYAQRPLTDNESQWRQAVSEWYPQWVDASRPHSPRDVDGVSRMPTRDLPVTHAPAAPPRFVPAPPAHVDPPAPVRPAPPAPARPAVAQPVFDFPGETERTPSGKEPYQVLPPGAPLNSEASPTGNSRPAWYSVQKGDTLTSIARQFYGDSSHWRRIYDANRSTLQAPDRLSPGVRIRLP